MTKHPDSGPDEYKCYKSLTNPGTLARSLRTDKPSSRSRQRNCMFWAVDVDAAVLSDEPGQSVYPETEELSYPSCLRLSRKEEGSVPARIPARFCSDREPSKAVRSGLSQFRRAAWNRAARGFLRLCVWKFLSRNYTDARMPRLMALASTMKLVRAQGRTRAAR